MLIEKFIFNILAFSLFIIIFSKLIRRNDTNYIFLLVLEAIGIALNFLELLIGGVFKNIIFKILMYVLSVVLPIIVILIENNGSNFSEMVSILEAKLLLYIGDKQAAKQVLLNLMDKYPDTYKGHVLLAKIYEKDGEMEKAIDEYVRTVDSNKKDYDSYFKISELLNNLGKKDEAITMLTNLLENKPDYYKASILLGDLLYEQERFKEAVSVYQDALKYKPADFELYYCLGMAYTRLNDFSNAKDCYAKAAEINHRLYMADYNLGQIALIEKDLEAAEKYFAECLMSDELEPDAYYQLAKIYMVKGDKDKAILFANKAIELDDSYYETISKEKIFEPIKKLISIPEKSIKRVKKISEKDKEIQKYLEETVFLIDDMNKNEIKNRATERVNEIFKSKEKEISEDLETKDIEDIQREKNY